MLEFYDSSGVRMDVPGSFRHDLDSPGGCAHTGLAYEIRLEPGEYLMVHRASSAPPGYEVVGAAPWTTYDGERALVVGFVVPSPRPFADAGI